MLIIYESVYHFENICLNLHRFICIGYLLYMHIVYDVYTNI